MHGGRHTTKFHPFPPQWKMMLDLSTSTSLLHLELVNGTIYFPLDLPSSLLFFSAHNTINSVIPPSVAYLSLPANIMHSLSPTLTHLTLYDCPQTLLIPDTVTHLTITGTNTSLPPLPPSLTFLSCSTTIFSKIQQLPPSLTHLCLSGRDPSLKDIHSQILSLKLVLIGGFNSLITVSGILDTLLPFLLSQKSYLAKYSTNLSISFLPPSHASPSEITSIN
jgi:hypothetical protein